ncbi:hypothetical protein BU15DRAFT_82124 [Melanogaster broomeanus]|nr:hypothetical protein BU15DRAFT_82124 [Melanogaster broomeanus]
MALFSQRLSESIRNPPLRLLTWTSTLVNMELCFNLKLAEHPMPLCCFQITQAVKPPRRCWLIKLALVLVSLQQSSPSTEGSGSPKQAIDPLIPPIAHLSTTINDMACISHGTSTTSTPTHGATSPLIQRCSTEPTPRQTRTDSGVTAAASPSAGVLATGLPNDTQSCSNLSAEASTSAGLGGKQPWRHDRNAPARPPSPVIPGSTAPLENVIDSTNIYGSDFPVHGATSDVDQMDPRHSSREDDDDDMEDEFRPQADDEEEGDEVCDGGPSLTSKASDPKPSTTRSTMPLWLDRRCKEVEQMLKVEIQQSTSSPARPKCYEQGRFWVWDESPLLMLMRRQSYVLEPDVFHRPSFFVWLPHCLLGDRIPCPQCRDNDRLTANGKTVFLQKFGWIGRARRVIDIDRNIYVVGYRYRCALSECRKTYRSWSPAILDVIPPAIAMQFPFQLTYRSGLTTRLAELLRSSIRAGIGPAPFAEMLQSFHYQRFDELHLQYLELIYSRYKACPEQFWVRKQSFGSFGDREGYAGFVPTHAYLRCFYDMVIEQCSSELKQCIAMLPARVLAIDHSFKIIKRLGKVGSAPLFTALHTVTNEHAEIRSMLFTMTKGHDHFVPNLQQISQSLKMFGHDDVQAVFTDNVRGDKDEVQRVFPSLLKDIVPVPAYSDLPPLEVPSEDDDDMEDEFRPQADDEEEGDEVCDGGPSLTSKASDPKPSTTRSTMPLWLDRRCKEVEQMLKVEIQQSTSSPARPKCYEQGRFWVWDESPLLMLMRRQSYVLEPDVFHRPSFFVWLPHCLLGDRIPCPQCRDNDRLTANGKTVFLQKFGWIGRARRVIDIDRNIYVVGYRYRCALSECRKTYRSWSPAILDVIPPAIAMQFPFQLTYRSGLTTRLAELLRSSIRAGIGPAPFAEMLQSFHYQRFDELHLQYLELIYSRYKACPEQFWVRKQSFGSFGDREGYAGFVPTHAYLRCFYDMVIEQCSSELKQCIAMLPARVLAIDHSFKIIKRLGKVGSAPLFTALHTVTNEHAEIRSMLFTMTKGHDHFVPNLQQISQSLKMFGHDDVQAVFTDNVRGDKDEVQRVFPSLLKDIVPVPAYSDLPPLEVPSGWSVVELSTAHQVNLRFDVIMNHRNTENPTVTAAFDMEWPVNLDTGIHSPVSLIQIAYQNTIYLIKTAAFVENGYVNLPHSLLTFLRAPCFTKAGVGISADFKRLQKDCRFTPSSQPFAGELELGTMARARGVQVKKNVGLGELVAVLLRHYLPNDPHIRVSPRWADPVLPPPYVEYATLDVYATLLVYLRLAGMTVTPPVTATTPARTPVTLTSPDGNQVARGIIAIERPPTLHGVKVTTSRSVITVSHVLVPSFLLPASLCSAGAKHSRALASHGSPPFLLVVNNSNLHVCVASNPDRGLCSGSAPNSELPAIEELPVVDPDTELPEEMPESSESFMQLDEDAEGTDGPDCPEQTLEGSSRDPMAETTFQTLIRPYLNHPEPEQLPETHPTRSRVVYDNFHSYHHIPISRPHGLRRPFCRALSAAFFLPVAEDKAAVERVLKKYGTSYNSQLLSKPKWVLARVRRHIPPPEILLLRVADVIETYGPLKDAKTGQPLFNPRAWEIARNLVENVRLGYYSDPSGVELYYKIGQDRDGLTLYRCCRGTNSVEGGVHQNLIRRYTSFNTSPRHAINV